MKKLLSTELSVGLLLSIVTGSCTPITANFDDVAKAFQGNRVAAEDKYASGHDVIMTGVVVNVTSDTASPIVVNLKSENSSNSWLFQCRSDGFPGPSMQRRAAALVAGDKLTVRGTIERGLTDRSGYTTISINSGMIPLYMCDFEN